MVKRGMLLCGALLAPIVCSAAGGSAAAPAGLDGVPLPTRQALTLLHQGRFDAATEAFRNLSARSPGDPEGPLFEALTAWWRLLDVPDDPALRQMLEAKLQAAIERGEALLEGGQAQRGRIFAGTACLLLAQTHAFAGSYVSAGKSARRGHDLLEQALAADPAASDARFALGAYKYFAARLPWLVRILRVFVRLPGGDADEGLAHLEQAARQGTYFRTEAQLLLAYIYSGDDEDDLRAALGWLETARGAERDSPLLAAIAARFHFEMGRLADAERVAGEAVALSERIAGVSPAIPAMARMRQALSLYYLYRPAEARQTIDSIGGAAGQMPEDAAARMEGLAERLRIDLAGGGAAAAGADATERGIRVAPAAPLPQVPGAAEALGLLREGRAAEAAASLERLASRHPADRVLRYHLARAWQSAGDHRKAEGILRPLLSSSPPLPKTLRGWAMIRLAVALESTGRAPEAKEWYRRCSALGGFTFRAAASDRLVYPAEPYSPEG